MSLKQNVVVMFVWNDNIFRSFSVTERSELLRAKNETGDGQLIFEKVPIRRVLSPIRIGGFSALMKLSDLQNVGSTINSDGSCLTAQKILDRWGHDTCKVKTVRLSSNFVFSFEHHGSKRFLRFTPMSERTVEQVQAETEWLTALEAAGLHVVKPVKSKHGNLVETVTTELGTFHASVFHMLPGSEREIEELDEGAFWLWGEALGKLHRVSSTCQSVHSRPNVDEHLDMVSHYISDDAPRLRQELEEVRAALTSFPKTGENYGLIHFDFELDNLKWDVGTIHALDFDDCAYNWYVADIAFALRDLVEERVDFENPLFQSFLAGYRTQYEIDSQILERISLFLRMRNLLGYAQNCRSLDIPESETRAWLKPLREKLTHKVNDYRLSLERRR